MSESLKCVGCGLVQFAEAVPLCLRCGLAYGRLAPGGESGIALDLPGLDGTLQASGYPAGPASVRPPSMSMYPAATSQRPPSMSMYPPSASHWTPDAAAVRDPWPFRIKLFAGLGTLLVAALIAGSFGFRALRRYAMAQTDGAAFVEHSSTDGVISIVTPPTFVDDVENRRENHLDLALRDERHRAGIVLSTVTKEQIGRVVTLTQVANASRGAAGELADIVLEPSVDIDIANHAAVEMAFDARFAQTPVHGYFYVIDGDGYYHVLIVWSFASSFARNDAMLREITSSLRFHLG